MCHFSAGFCTGPVQVLCQPCTGLADPVLVLYWTCNVLYRTRTGPTPALYMSCTGPVHVLYRLCLVSWCRLDYNLESARPALELDGRPRKSEMNCPVSTSFSMLTPCWQRGEKSKQCVNNRQTRSDRADPYHQVITVWGSYA